MWGEIQGKKGGKEEAKGFIGSYDRHHEVEDSNISTRPKIYYHSMTPFFVWDMSESLEKIKRYQVSQV
jgi:hypothetical protein